MKKLFEITGDVKLGHSYHLIGQISLSNPMIITGKVLIGNEKTYEIYDGEYEIVPKVYEQILETDQMLMIDDVTVHEITFNKVQNEKGLTVQIGEI